MKRRIISLLLAAMMALAVSAPPAFAAGGKCNAGDGNGGEYSFHEECDPGNSGAHNNADDGD